MKRKDTLYFGSIDESQSEKKLSLFKKSLKSTFPKSKTVETTSKVTGYCMLEASLNSSDWDDYIGWLIANGWSLYSKALLELSFDPSSNVTIENYKRKAEEKYPHLKHLMQ